MRAQIKKRIQTTIAITHIALYRSIHIVFALIAVLAILYVYFVGSAIVSIVVYKQIDKEKNELFSNIADLETVYLNKKEMLTYDLSKSMGLVATYNKKFVERNVFVGQAN